MDLPTLVELLREYALGVIPLATIHDRLGPILASDPLDVAANDAEPWERAPDETRLFWRLVYLVESGDEDDAPLREQMRRIVASLDSTRSSVTTHELLPVIVDASRLCVIIRKHLQGIVSRTSLLSVVAESGYPEHVKLWLQHAPSPALARLCERLDADAYDAVAAAFEVPPA
jgi:hypothetical protein